MTTLLQKIVEAAAKKQFPEQFEPEIVTEAEKFHEVDNATSSIGDFLVWTAGFRTNENKGQPTLIDEVIVYVYNRVSKKRFKVEIYFNMPVTITNVDEVDMSQLESMVWDATESSTGKPVRDEEVEAFATRLAASHLQKTFADTVANILDPDTSDYDPSDDTHLQRREKMRQAADARAELDID